MTEPADTQDAVVFAHAHTWDAVSGACTVSDCTRQKPQWLVDTETESLDASSAGGPLSGWRRISKTGRWLLFGALIAIVASLLLPSITSALTNGTLPGMNSDPIVQYGNPANMGPADSEPLPAPTVAPFAPVAPAQPDPDLNVPYVDETCASGWGMNGACGGE